MPSDMGDNDNVQMTTITKSNDDHYQVKVCFIFIFKSTYLPCFSADILPATRN